MTTAIQEYSATEAALASLSQKYKGVLFDVTTPMGMDTARKGRAEIRTYRTSLEKKRVELKADVLERGRLIDGEAKRITGELESLEIPIDEQIKKEEKRVEDIRLAKVREEAATVAEAERLAKEAEERRMDEERAEIERQKAELRKAEQARIEAEAASQRKIEDEQRAARLRLEEEERAARRAREAEEAKIAEQRRQDQAKIDAERAEVDRQRRLVEEAQRKEREAEEQRQRAERLRQEEADREERRKAQAVMDARTTLVTFRDQYKDVEEFAGVVKAINAYLKGVKP